MFFHRTQFSQNSDPTACMSLPSWNREGSSSLSVPGRRTSSINVQNSQQTESSRKESVLSPKTNEYHACLHQQRAGMTRCARTSSLTSLSDLGKPGSLTVEAALELPLLFLLIAIVLQYAVVFRAAAQFSGAIAPPARPPVCLRWQTIPVWK